MKKETLTEKLIKRIYGISGPLDEYKRREADRIGNQVFIVLFYLMIFGNLIPLSSLINIRKLSLSAILLWYSAFR